MSTRLQVVVSEQELRTFQRAARRDGLTLSEWVRRTLREAHGRQATGAPDRKLAAVRTAVGHDFPTADIEIILGDIERGALSERV